MATQTEPVLFSWEQVARALFIEGGIKEGLWQIGAALKFAAATTGPKAAEMMPSGVVAVEKLLLVPATGQGPLVFDASELVSGARAVAARPPKERKISVPTKRAPQPK